MCNFNLFISPKGRVSDKNNQVLALPICLLNTVFTGSSSIANPKRLGILSHSRGVLQSRSYDLYVFQVGISKWVVKNKLLENIEEKKTSGTFHFSTFTVPMNSGQSYFFIFFSLICMHPVIFLSNTGTRFTLSIYLIKVWL